MAINGRAISGTLKHSYFYVNWQQSSQSTAGNYTIINWQAGLNCGTSSSWDAWYSNAVKINSITADGQTLELDSTGVTSKTFSNISGAGDHQLASGTAQINHNTNGEKTFTITISGWLYTYGNTSGNEDFTLTKIPRQANITSFSVSKRDETSVKYNFTTDANCDWAWYSTDNGSTWANLPNNSVVSRLSSNTSQPLSYNTTYNFKLRVRRTDSQLTTDSSTYTQTTYDIPFCKPTSNFTIGDTLNLELYNPLGREVTVTIIADDGSTKSTGPYTGTSVSGFKVDSWKEFWYASIPEKRKGKYKVKTSWNGYEWTRNSGSEYLINEAECLPTFTRFEYEDRKEESLNLTGDNPQIIINNYNDVKVIINPENKAIPKKHAWIKKYRATCGNLSDEKDYSEDSEVVLNLGCIKDRNITVYAIDSREVSTPVLTSISNDNWRNYSDILIESASIEREDGVGTTATLSFQGTIWNYTFGAKENAITECQYKYKKTNESKYSEPIKITPTREEDLFSFNSTIKGDLGADGFNLSNSFDIQIIISDEIRTATYNVLLGAGTPAMAIHPDGVSIGAPYSESLGGCFQVKGKNIADLLSGVVGDTLPIGAVIEWDSDTIPANWLLLNGQAVSRTEYKELFSLYGTRYGAGDGKTTFNLPDRRTRVPVGKSSSDTAFDTLGETGGAKTHTHTQGATGGPSTNTSGSTALTVAQMPSHRHHVSSRSTIATGSSSTWRAIASGDSTNADYSYDSYTTYVGSGSGHTHTLSSHTHTNPTTASSSSLQPYIVTNFIVKAKQIDVVVATVVDTLASSSKSNALSANQGRILNEKIDNLVIPESTTSIVDVTQLPTITSENEDQIIRYNNILYFVQTDAKGNKSWVATSTGGSGSAEIAIGAEKPTGEEVLWIEEFEDVEYIVPERHIITAIPNDNYTFTVEKGSKTVIPLGLIKTTVGNKLKLNSDGSINVTKANKVLVSAIVEISPYDTGENNLMQLRISRDGGTSGEKAYSMITSMMVGCNANGGSMYTLSISAVLEDVSDVSSLSLQVYSGNAGSFMIRNARTCLTIEMIE